MPVVILKFLVVNVVAPLVVALIESKIRGK
jgi:hypothetical protein